MKLATSSTSFLAPAQQWCPYPLSMIWQVGNVFCILCFQSWGSKNTFFILEGKRAPSFEIILPNTVDSLPGRRQFVPAKVVWLSPTWPYLSTSPSWPRWLWSISCRCKAICQECQRKWTRPETMWGGGSEFLGSFIYICIICHVRHELHCRPTLWDTQATLFLFRGCLEVGGIGG